MSFSEHRRALMDQMEALLQLDVRFYGRSFTLLSLSHSTGVIRGLATTVLMAWWLDPTVLGQFRYLLAIFGIAGIFSLPGMSAAVIRGVSQGDTVVARVALRRIFLFAPFGSALLLLAASERWWAGEPTVMWAFVVSALAFVPYSAVGLYGDILTGQERIKRLSAVSAGNNLLFSALFAAILFFVRDLVWITVAYFALDLLLRGSLTMWTLAQLPSRGSVNDHLRLGNHLSGIGVMQAVAAQLDKLLIQRFAGYQTLALYSIAAVIPEQIKFTVNSLSGTFLQRLARHAPTPAHLRVTRRHFWIGMLLATGLMGGYALVAPALIPFVFPQYAAGVWLSVVYALGLLSLPATVGMYFFQAHGQLRALWRFSTANAFLQIIANLVLIPLFGNWGAVWSKNISRLGGLPFAYPVLEKASADDGVKKR